MTDKPIAKVDLKIARERVRELLRLPKSYYREVMKNGLWQKAFFEKSNKKIK